MQDVEWCKRVAGEQFYVLSQLAADVGEDTFLFSMYAQSSWFGLAIVQNACESDGTCLSELMPDEWERWGLSDNESFQHQLMAQRERRV